MEPRLETIPVKIFAGMRITMSYADNKTGQLWRAFMPRRNEIESTLVPELYSIEIYPPQFFANFNPFAVFEKWAAVEAPTPTALPAEMEPLTVPGGLYAVFVHCGPAVNGPETYRYIFTEWLPASGYKIDERPHFAIMGEKYDSESVDSEEEIWIPVKIS
jgi:AraC family transcriptional regulator